MADLKLVALFLIVCSVAGASAAPAEPQNVALAQKFDFLASLLKQYNVDVDAIRAKILEASEERHRAKRETSNPIDEGLTGILDGVYGAIAAALKSITDTILKNINTNTNGVMSDVLLNLQAFVYGLIDKTFPSKSTTYTSNLYYAI